MTPEAKLQTECVKWFRYAYPRYQMLFFAIPNGGSRNEIEARNLKLQGVVAGVSDTCLAVPQGKYHGLYVEFKYGKNDLSEKQEEFLKQVAEQGYATATVWTFDEFSNVINDYFNENR